MRRLPALRRVRHCQAGIGWCTCPAPLPVQGTPHTVLAPAPTTPPKPAEITGGCPHGVPGNFPASYRLVT